MTERRVTSKRAAQIVGVGYEGFRSYLKRGLLGRVGMLPGFHAPGADTHDDPAPRSGWQTFGATDLCLMRLAKMLMDGGFSFASANSVVSNYALWQRLQHDEGPTDRYILLWPPYSDYMLFDTADLVHLPQRIEEAKAMGVLTMINIGDIQRDVFGKLSEGAKAS